MNIVDIHFLYPNIIWISIIVSTIAVYLFTVAEKKISMDTVANDDMKQVFGIGVFGRLLRILLVWSIGIIMGVILAHPYALQSDIEIKKDGIDIMLVLDISGSMDFNDFEPSRLTLAKETLAAFVREISSDRVGLLVFAGKPISSQPLTFDYAIIEETLNSLSTEILNQNIPGLSGTNIGDALLLAQTSFDKQEREKVIILVTDGDANSGADPALVAQLLKKDSIIVYSVGIGRDSETQVKTNNGFFQQNQIIPPLNSAILETISKNTDGIFFRASDSQTLKKIFKKLEELQTSEIVTNISQYKADHYKPFVAILVILLGLLSFIELIHPRCK